MCIFINSHTVNATNVKKLTVTHHKMFLHIMAEANLALKIYIFDNKDCNHRFFRLLLFQIKPSFTPQQKEAAFIVTY